MHYIILFGVTFTNKLITMIQFPLCRSFIWKEKLFIARKTGAHPVPLQTCSPPRLSQFVIYVLNSDFTFYLCLFLICLYLYHSISSGCIFLSSLLPRSVANTHSSLLQISFYPVRSQLRTHHITLKPNSWIYNIIFESIKHPSPAIPTIFINFLFFI